MADDVQQSLLEEFGLDALDLDQVEVPSYDIPDGPYEFTVGDLFIKKGSKNQPEKAWIILEYLVGEGGKRFSELWEVPKDIHNMTDDESTKMGRYKGRLISLGVDESQVNSATREDIVGISGTFQLRTTEGKKPGSSFQNIRNLRVSGDGLNEFAPEAAEVDTEAEAPAKTVKPKPATKAPAKVAPAKAATAVDNPFAPKG